MAGLSLKRLGHNITILERSPMPLLHDQGAGIVLGSETQAFFTRYDRTRREIAVTCPLRQYLNKSGEQITREDMVQRMTSWDLLYHVLRANFDGVQSEYCKVPEAEEGDGEAMYKYGCTVEDIRDSESEVEVVLREGEQRTILKSDICLAVDGPGSTVRAILEPQVERKYAGYVAWRGTVPQGELAEHAADTLVDRFTFYHADNVQFLAYLIPGTNGALESGHKLMNWVWYVNYLEGSEELNELMTDTSGRRHNVTLPVGKMQESVLSKQRERASKVLPPQFAELVNKTKQPFIQAITDVISPKCSYFNGKLMLMGDALAGFRPHTAASTSQAAYNALMLVDCMQGEISLAEYDAAVIAFATRYQALGVSLGQRSQFGIHPWSA